jgi:hypothetical protein
MTLSEAKREAENKLRTTGLAHAIFLDEVFGDHRVYEVGTMNEQMARATANVELVEVVNCVQEDLGL